MKYETELVFTLGAALLGWYTHTIFWSIVTSDVWGVVAWTLCVFAAGFLLGDRAMQKFIKWLVDVLGEP